MATTTKKTQAVSEAEARQAALDYSQAQAHLKSLQAMMNKKVSEAKAAYADAILKASEDSQAAEALLKCYAAQVLPTPDGKKSCDLFHVTIGYRLSPARLCKPDERTWEEITATVAKLHPGLVRTVQELNKEALLELRDDAAFKKIAAKTGVEVVQKEDFYVRAKG